MTAVDSAGVAGASGARELAAGLPPGQHALWPTPLGVFHWDAADALNPLLARQLGALRLAQCQARDASHDAPFFASDDDLLQRWMTGEGRALVRFVVASLQATVAQANVAAWPPGRRGLQVVIEGMWFQCSRGGAFHDLHTHGNCSWSGVYVVQADADPARSAHPVYGALNGVTRLHGPYFGPLGGAHVDLGNAWLQPPHADVPPRPGQLLVFPSWLAHQALPYDGVLERIVVSFNASVHAGGGGDRLHAYAAG